MFGKPVKFPPGQIVATPAVISKVPQPWLLAALAKHLSGDWGLLDAEDKAANDAALRHGARLLSAYALPDADGKFWIITEADRSVTTFLLPSDY